MPGEISSSVVIDRPVEEVFGYVLDLDENGPQWAEDLLSVTKTTDGPVASGTTFSQRQKVLFMTRDTSLTFVEVVPNERIYVEAELGPIAPRMTATFEAEGDGTRVTFSGTPNPKGPLGLLSPLIEKQGQKVWDNRTSRLKKVLESRS